MNDSTIWWIIAFLAWSGIAILSAIEAAFNSLNRVKVEMESRRGVVSSRFIQHFFQQRPVFNYTLNIGQIVTLIFMSIAGSILLDHLLIDLFQEWPFSIILLLKILLLTLFYLIFGIMIPALIAKANPAGTVSFLVYPFLIYYFLLYPVSKSFVVISAGWLRKNIPGSQSESDEEILERIDIYQLKTDPEQKKKSEESLDSEVRIFQNALEFPEIKLHECMIPRTEIIAAEENESIENLTKLFIESGLSRILIYRKDIDNIVGYFKSSDLFKKPSSIRSGVTTLPFLPESMLASQLLDFFIKEKKNIAVVVDEFGGTAGIITIEDVIEEIFGDIEDEHDVNRLPEERVSDHEFILSGRLEIDYLNETYQLDIPESDEYNTLNGFILKHHPTIPIIQESLEIGEFLITILEVSAKRIELINLKITKNH